MLSITFLVTTIVKTVSFWPLKDEDFLSVRQFRAIKNNKTQLPKSDTSVSLSLTLPRVIKTCNNDISFTS